jgi:hypothetical protein
MPRLGTSGPHRVCQSEDTPAHRGEEVEGVHTLSISFPASHCASSGRFFQAESASPSVMARRAFSHRRLGANFESSRSRRRSITIERFSSLEVGRKTKNLARANPLVLAQSNPLVTPNQDSKPKRSSRTCSGGILVDFLIRLAVLWNAELQLGDHSMDPTSPSSSRRITTQVYLQRVTSRFVTNWASRSLVPSSTIRSFTAS